MANTEFTECKYGHSVEDRYRRPNGLPSNHLSCRGCAKMGATKYRLAHPDRIKISTSKYIASHLEACRIRTRLYAYAHREEKARIAAELRKTVLTKLGGVCLRCGFSDVRALQIDHINGGGSQELNKGVRKMLLKILVESAGYQLLCANCNAIKKHENHEVPHPRSADTIAMQGGAL